MLRSAAIKQASKLISLQETAKRLDINRGTSYQWIAANLLLPQGSQRITGRNHYWFDPAYIEQVKDALPKRRSPAGGHLLTDDVIKKLKALVFQQKAKQGDF